MLKPTRSTGHVKTVALGATGGATPGPPRRLKRNLAAYNLSDHASIAAKISERGPRYNTGEEKGHSSFMKSGRLLKELRSSLVNHLLLAAGTAFEQDGQANAASEGLVIRVAANGF